MKITLIIFTCIYSIFFSVKGFGETHSKLNLISNESKSSKIDSITNSYLDKADDHFRRYNIDSLKLYLDSLSFYEEKVINLSILGDYYNLLGLYFTLKENKVRAYQSYYKAIDIYEKNGKLDLLIPVYNNLAFSYIQKHDIESLEKIISKMQSIASTSKDKSDIINTYRIISFYFNCKYEKDLTQIAFLDSSIYYDKQIISIYEKNKELDLRSEDLAYNYMNLVSNSLRKNEFNIDSLTIYLGIMKSLMSPNDTTMLINKLWLEGEIEYHKGNIPSAKQIYIDQLKLMKSWSPQKELSMYTDVYDRLTEIAEKQYNYKEAFQYQQKKIECLNQIHDVQKYESIREVETRYEVEKKEQEIIQLTERNNFQRTINNLYLYLFLLAGVVFYLFFRWRKQKDKATKTQLALTQLEKEDAILKLKKMELEKFEVLSDNRFKEGKLSEMNEEVKKLRENRDELIAEVEEFAEKVKEYENREVKDHPFATYDTLYTSLVQDVYDLICKRLPDSQEKKEYIETLLKIDDHFFEILKTKASKKLSDLNLQHCICFYMNMKTEHVVECIPAESRSIHQTRHRLKKTFNVPKDIDINRFLKQIME